MGVQAKPLFDAVEHEVVRRRGRDMKHSQDIANMVWGFAAVKHPAPRMFKVLQLQMMAEGCRVLGTFEGQTTAVVAEAYASMQHGSDQLYVFSSRICLIVRPFPRSLFPSRKGWAMRLESRRCLIQPRWNGAAQA
jgi:hypothetical protein